MSIFKLKYVNTTGLLYKEAVKIREALFFKNMMNSSDLIQDSFESKGIHLVCLDQDEVIGTGRLNIENSTSIISQMAIKRSHQKQGVGAKILNELVKYSKEKEVINIKVSARETAVAFYNKFNFVANGDKYPSQKTGIIHQQMVLKIN
ncbi:GNAT family N-acetyltransferase [uncultured Algibacter sp.]|uniref:GNAT family N-acetyltransferase n=1 Tax=uncultured Algibacter sp. TaxID=298659 RepID=UPI002602392D|nr:GNAT family N-acetyltransferase [uncultured Algibacter sp.]